MSKYKNALEYIEAITDDECVIVYDEGDYNVMVNEDVDIDSIYSAIATVVDSIVEREFEYELIDIMLPFFLIDLFTDIEVPKMVIEGEEYPDYMACYKIASYLNLEYELTQASPLVASYIYMITQNIWRKLEYHKSQGAFIQRQLTDTIAEFYNIMDDLDEFVEKQGEIDVDDFMNKLNTLTEMIQEADKSRGYEPDQTGYQLPKGPTILETNKTE